MGTYSSKHAAGQATAIARNDAVKYPYKDDHSDSYADDEQRAAPADTVVKIASSSQQVNAAPCFSVHFWLTRSS